MRIVILRNWADHGTGVRENRASIDLLRVYDVSEWCVVVVEACLVVVLRGLLVNAVMMYDRILQSRLGHQHEAYRETVTC